MPQTPCIKISEGEKIPDPTTTTRNGGDVVLLGNSIPLVCLPTDPNLPGSNTLDIEGLYDVPKDSSVFAVGDPVFWNPTGSPVTGTASSGAATSTSSATYRMGFATVAALTGDSYVRTKMTMNRATTLSATVAASSAVSNTTSETNFDTTIVIPANTLKAGDVIRVRAQGIATATNSTDTLTAKLKLGSTAIAATAAQDVANNDIFWFDFDIVVRTVGASGTMVAGGVQGIGASGTATAKTTNLASTAVDTTAAITVQVSATWSVASTGDSCRLDILTVQVLRGA